MEKTMYSDTGYHIGVFFFEVYPPKTPLYLYFDEALI